MNQPSKSQITCYSCGSSNTDPIAPCKRFYSNDDVVICDRCKGKGQWANLEPVLWVGSKAGCDRRKQII